MSEPLRYKPILLTILGAIIGVVCSVAFAIQICGESFQGAPPNPTMGWIVIVVFVGSAIALCGAVIWLVVTFIVNCFRADVHL